MTLIVKRLETRVMRLRIGLGDLGDRASTSSVGASREIVIAVARTRLLQAIRDREPKALGHSDLVQPTVHTLSIAWTAHATHLDDNISRDSISNSPRVPRNDLLSVPIYSISRLGSLLIPEPAISTSNTFNLPRTFFVPPMHDFLPPRRAAHFSLSQSLFVPRPTQSRCSAESPASGAGLVIHRHVRSSRP